MDFANYVNKVGKEINESTKYNIKVDRQSIESLILYNHLNQLLEYANETLGLTIYEEPITQEDINKLKGYINCLKKEINFSLVRDVVPNCILTETEEHIIQE